jgi:hypothetical protein
MDRVPSAQHHLEGNLARFLDYWRGLRREAELPRRSDFDPRGIADLLPYITLVAIAGERFQVRLIGTEVHRRIKRSFRVGMMLDELETGSYLAFLTQVYSTVIAMRQPVASHTAYDSAQGQIFIQRLTVPFSDQHGEATQLMSVLAFSHTPDQHKAAAISAEAVHSMHVVAEL